MSLELEITDLLLPLSKAAKVQAGDAAFKCRRDALMAAAEGLCDTFVDECQNFIACYFSGSVDAAGKCFKEGKGLFEGLGNVLEPSFHQSEYIIGDTLISMYKSKLEAARPEDEPVGFWEDVESFTMHHLVEARAFVGNGGADFAVACGVARDAKQKYADELAAWGTEEKKKCADELEGFFETVMEMGSEDKEKTVRMIVRAVDAALHMYSAATVAEYAASKGAAIAPHVIAAAKAAKAKAAKAKAARKARKAAKKAARKAETVVDGSAPKRQKR